MTIEAATVSSDAAVTINKANSNMKEITMIKITAATTMISLAAMTGALAQSVSGTIKKIDVSAGKMTIVHGPIKNLKMESMTMVFRVKDPAMLTQVKAGNKILFDADRVNGALTVIKMKKR